MFFVSNESLDRLSKIFLPSNQLLNSHSIKSSLSNFFLLLFWLGWECLWWKFNHILMFEEVEWKVLQRSRRSFKVNSFHSLVQHWKDRPHEVLVIRHVLYFLPFCFATIDWSNWSDANLVGLCLLFPMRSSKRLYNSKRCTTYQILESFKIRCV